MWFCIYYLSKSSMIWEFPLPGKVVFFAIGILILMRHGVISMANLLIKEFPLWKDKINGLVQDCCKSVANALELLQSCTKQSRWSHDNLSLSWWIHVESIWVGSQRYGSLVAWFCYQLIARPGNKTGAARWPDPYTWDSGLNVDRLPQPHSNSPQASKQFETTARQKTWSGAYTTISAAQRSQCRNNSSRQREHITMHRTTRLGDQDF